MYKALSYFEDLMDNGMAYRAGDAYPRPGYEPSPSRIAELSGTANVRGVPVIAEASNGEAEPKKRKRKNAD